MTDPNMITRSAAPGGPSRGTSRVAIERVESVSGHRLRVSGRWRRSGGAAADEPLLVVTVGGRRHRFAPDGTDQSGRSLGEWDATFTLPHWALPYEQGQASLWIGTDLVPLPLPGQVEPEAAAEIDSESGPVAEAVAGPGGPFAARRALAPSPLGDASPWPTAGLRPAQTAVLTAPVPDGGRSGPLAELLLRESLGALRAELAERSTEATGLAAQLTAVRAQLDAKASAQAALEAAQAALREQLAEMTMAVEARRDLSDERSRELALALARDDAQARARELEQRIEREKTERDALRGQLAAAQVGRDAARSEAAGLRTELERLGSDLTAAREGLAAEGGDLGEARRLLAEAQALSASLRRGS